MRRFLACALTSLLCACAPPQRTYPAGESLLGRSPSSPDWSAASARARYQAHWITPRLHTIFFLDVRTLGSMGRMDMTLPSGIPIASLTWHGDHWQEYLPHQSTLLEGQGEAVPIPPLGISTFPLLELERLARGLLIPPDAAHRPFTTLYAGKGIRVLLSEPDSLAQRWALHLSETDGFVQRIQRFQGPIQVEDLQFASYLPNVTIPNRFRREFDTSTSLNMELTAWTDQNFVSPTELLLPDERQLDTISIGTDHSGRRYYTMRLSHPDSVLPFPKDFLADLLNTAVDSSDEDDTASDSTVDGSSEPELDEEDLEAEDSAPAPAPPTTEKDRPSLPAILKPSPSMPAPGKSETPATDASSAPPPTEAIPRKF